MWSSFSSRRLPRPFPFRFFNIPPLLSRKNLFRHVFGFLLRRNPLWCFSPVHFFLSIGFFFFSRILLLSLPCFGPVVSYRPGRHPLCLFFFPPSFSVDVLPPLLIEHPCRFSATIPPIPFTATFFIFFFFFPRFFPFVLYGNVSHGVRTKHEPTAGVPRVSFSKFFFLKRILMRYLCDLIML